MNSLVKPFSNSNPSSPVHSLNGLINTMSQSYSQFLRAIAIIPKLILFTLMVVLIHHQQTAFAQVGEPYQLSGEMVALGDLIQPGIEPPPSYRLSPDGQYAVYSADQRVDGIFELFSVPIAGGPVVQLNPEFGANSDISFQSFRISSDSTRVVYMADQRVDGVVELFSVPITGGTAISLNSNSSANSRVRRFTISPDSSRVVYVGDMLVDEQYELFMVSITGGSSIRLNSNLVENGEVLSLQISPDSSRVIYLADQIINNERELFSVPITGGTPIRLLPSMVSGGSVQQWRISPDGQRVVYLADRRTDTLDELFSVPIAGGATIRLSPNLFANGDVNGLIRISTDSQRVVFRADHQVDDVNNLFSARINQASPTQLNPILSANEEVASYAISPDASRVVYTTDRLSNDRFRLWSVPIEGGTSFQISATSFFANSDVSNFRISSDSQRVVYRADTFIDDAFTLFSTPILGPNFSPGEIIQLVPNLLVNREVFRDFEITPDNQRVIYRADSRINGVNEIFSVPLLGGATTRLNRDLPFGSDIDDFLINPNSDVVIYQGDPDVFDESELFAHRLLPPITIEDELCFPIKAANGHVAVVCL